MSPAGVVRCLIPVHVGIIVDAGISGYSASVTPIGGRTTLSFPKWTDAGPVEPPEGFERVDPSALPLKTWGDRTYTGQVRINAIGFTINMSGAWLNLEGGALPKDFEDLTIAGDDLDAQRGELTNWLQRFLDWTQALLAQPLDITSPIAGSLDIKGAAMVTWAEVGDRQSWLSPLSHGRGQTLTRVIPSSGSTASERVLDRAGLDHLTRLTDKGDPMPLSVALLGNARIAYRRRRLREAIVDLGTAAESILTHALPSLAGPKDGLGTLFTKAQVAGITIPPDTKTAFVKPRNDAVHRGTSPTDAYVMRGLEIVDGLIRTHLPGYSADVHTPVAARQPFQSLTLFAPRKPA